MILFWGMWYEPYPHQKICSIQFLSYLPGFGITWSISVQVFWVARVIHGSLVKRAQTQRTCVIHFNLLHYLCLICFPGMDWCARNNSFFIFLDKLKGQSIFLGCKNIFEIELLWDNGNLFWEQFFKLSHHSLNLELPVAYWL